MESTSIENGIHRHLVHLSALTCAGSPIGFGVLCYALWERVRQVFTRSRHDSMGSRCVVSVSPCYVVCLVLSCLCRRCVVSVSPCYVVCLVLCVCVERCVYVSPCVFVLFRCVSIVSSVFVEPVRGTWKAWLHTSHITTIHVTTRAPVTVMTS